MENTLIYHTLSKIAIPFLDVDYHIETLFKFNEDEWFEPTNRDSNDFAVCDYLSNLYLIEIKRTPVWTEGGFRGIKAQYRYNRNLDY